MMDKIFVIREKLDTSRTIRVPEQLFKRISELADKSDISFNKAVNHLLRYAISKAEFALKEEI